MASLDAAFMLECMLKFPEVSGCHFVNFYSHGSSLITYSGGLNTKQVRYSDGLESLGSDLDH